MSTFNVCGATTDSFRVRVTDLGRGKTQHPPREYDVAPGSAIPNEWSAVDRYAADCGIPPLQPGKRMSVYYSRFRVDQVPPVVAAPAPALTPCRWSFDDAPTFAGFTDGTTWNGWANVWVDAETHAAVLAALAANGDPMDESVAEFRAMQPDPATGLVSYAGGYCATLEPALNPAPAHTPANVAAIAAAYVAVLHDWLSADELAAVRSGEAHNEHDFCDANMAMDEAFTRCGFESLPDLEDGMPDATLALWNEAANVAAVLLRDPAKLAAALTAAAELAYRQGEDATGGRYVALAADAAALAGAAP